MRSRRDQVQSYQFMVQRLVAALVVRETDPARSPFRRSAAATLASLLIAAVALGVAAGYGAVAGGDATGWRDPAVVIVEKESGARYVYLGERLHPVLNYASALLIAGSTSPRTVLVSRRSIEGVPRGVPLGIPDAPDSLPAPDRLLRGPWTVCSVATRDARSPARSVLMVGAEAGGGVALGEDAVLAAHPDGSVYLIWRQRRHLVRDRDLVFPAFGWTGARPVPISPALLNALPAGADLAPLRLAGSGERSARVTGARVGEVFVVTSLSGERQYAVATRDGLAVVTQVQAALLLAARGQDEPIHLPQGRFTGLPRVPDLVPRDAAAPPATIPRLAPVPGGSVCGTVRDDSGVAEVRVGASVPQAAAGPATGARATTGGVLVDRVIVEPGRGALVEAAAAPGATGGTVSLVTDLGRRYPVAGTEVLAMLGYGDVAPLRLPAGLVALVPAGEALDPVSARTPVARPA